MEKKVFVVRSTAKRDAAIGAVAAVLVLALLAYAVVSMSRGVSGKGLTGKITAKHFTPQPEQQITLGHGGLRERRLDGEYRFEVHVEPGHQDYTVWVDKSVYDSRNVGDSFYFLRPPNAASPAR
ncbi:MAG: hypothetical protein QOD99_593 [Chthoniobacter sp.]|nr:hypothetical protein [Chthoniobacter sp.]